jgi:N6-L-threonylcarbamoyladenine synthase
VLCLAIESSCDETAAAIVEETPGASHPWRIRSSVIASQVAIHREWGGVVPELASRQHIRDICGVLERSLADAGGLKWADLDLVAATQGPGLVGSLLIGLSAAKSIALSIEKPFVAVHHLAGHIESLFLHNGPLPLPAVVLVVSGGHTSLYFLPDEGEYRFVGRTRDDAAGEAYDKVAKLLGLGYPGGPVIDKLAKEGNDRAIDFPVTQLKHPDRNRNRITSASAAAQGLKPAGFEQVYQYRAEFSFSGLKTAVMRHVKHRAVELGVGAGGTSAASTPVPPLERQEIADICASFQRAVVEALLDRTFEAAKWLGARSIGIAGGVSANSRLRADATARGERVGIPVFVPSLALTTDNAAMIAAAGLRRYHAGTLAALDVNADANLPLKSASEP